MHEEELVDVVAAARRCGCDVQTVRRRIKDGILPARKAKVTGRDGCAVVKMLIRVTDLEDVFRLNAHDEHVRKIREAAKPFTAEQKSAIRQTFLAHLRDRKAQR